MVVQTRQSVLQPILLLVIIHSFCSSASLSASAPSLSSKYQTLVPSDFHTLYCTQLSTHIIPGVPMKKVIKWRALPTNFPKVTTLDAAGVMPFKHPKKVN